MAFDDTKTSILGPIAFVAIVTAVVVPILGAFEINGIKAVLLWFGILLGSWAGPWLALNAVNIRDEWRNKS